MSVEPENTNTRFIDPVSSQFIASSMIKLLDFFLLIPCFESFTYLLC